MLQPIVMMLTIIQGSYVLPEPFTYISGLTNVSSKVIRINAVDSGLIIVLLKK